MKHNRFQMQKPYEKRTSAQNNYKAYKFVNITQKKMRQTSHKEAKQTTIYSIASIGPQPSTLNHLS